MEFKDILKEVMIELDLNQVGLAKRLGMTQGQLNHWTTGKSVPTYHHLQNICKKLNISGDRILGLIDN